MAGTIITELGRITIDEDILANIACLLDSQEYVDRLVRCRTADEVYRLLTPLNETEE